MTTIFNNPGSVHIHDQENQVWLIFDKPVQTYYVQTIQEVVPAFTAAHKRAVRDKLFMVCVSAMNLHQHLTANST